MKEYRNVVGLIPKDSFDTQLKDVLPEEIKIMLLDVLDQKSYACAE